ncbi:MAG TPA: preprotein translocase subunit SecE [Candidatus Paceibacterota bacterium]|nr:preprotein translocase subunit SecE [Candidatus Paceibacterota bacterium]
MLQYIKDVRGELRHVSWPTRAQAIMYTIVVIAVSLATAVYLGLWDYIFTAFIQRII